MNFKSYIENICCKANNKIKALFRIRSFLTLKQSKVLEDVYILSNYRYCPLVLTFYRKCSNNLIMKTHYQCLRATYNTQIKTYRDLLHINGKIDIHTQSIQISMTEIYECLTIISPSFTWDYYNKKVNHYNLRQKHLSKLNNCRTKTYGLNTAVSKGPIIWNNLLNHVKKAKSWFANGHSFHVLAVAICS